VTYLWPRDKIIAALKRRFDVTIDPNKTDRTWLNLEDRASGVRFSAALWPKSAERPNEIERYHFISIIDGVSVSQGVLDSIASQLIISELSIWEEDGTTIFLQSFFEFKAGFSDGVINDIIDAWMADISKTLSALRRYSPNVRALREYAVRLGIKIDVESVGLPKYRARHAARGKNFVARRHL
jgi:hypothetical protein